MCKPKCWYACMKKIDTERRHTRVKYSKSLKVKLKTGNWGKSTRDTLINNTRVETWQESQHKKTHGNVNKHRRNTGECVLVLWAVMKKRRRFLTPSCAGKFFTNCFPPMCPPSCYIISLFLIACQLQILDCLKYNYTQIKMLTN